MWVAGTMRWGVCLVEFVDRKGRQSVKHSEVKQIPDPPAYPFGRDRARSGWCGRRRLAYPFERSSVPCFSLATWGTSSFALPQLPQLLTPVGQPQDFTSSLLLAIIFKKQINKQKDKKKKSAPSHARPKSLFFSLSWQKQQAQINLGPDQAIQNKFGCTFVEELHTESYSPYMHS